MKVFLALCLIALVLSVNGHKCGRFDCTDDQCCLRPMFGGYRCGDLGKEGDLCSTGVGMIDRCPCVKGLVCESRVFWRTTCIKSDKTTTLVPTDNTAVPTNEIATEVPSADTTTEDSASG